MHTIEEIHDSFVNGQKRQAVEWIAEWDEGEFFSRYDEYLRAIWGPLTVLNYFSDMVVSYFRIRGR